MNACDRRTDPLPAPRPASTANASLGDACASEADRPATDAAARAAGALRASEEFVAAAATSAGRLDGGRANGKPVRVAAVLPTFDNARTLAGVIDGVLATGLPVIVVDDGSTDGTADVLATFVDRVLVVIHPSNRGKAAALRSGFALAERSGHTHAVTIDTDGQHDPADLATLIAVAAAAPAALVLGTRDTLLAGYPPKNRLGRWSANTLVRWECGLNVADSQCGLRVYPLAAVGRTYVGSDRYGYETEILTRLTWAGVPTVQTSVRCVYDLPGGRVSHYRPLIDTLRAARLHLWLLGVRVGRWLNPASAWHEARVDPAARDKLAIALAVGVFIANTPLLGLHTVLSVVAARRFKLQPLAVLIGSHANTPPVGPLLVTLAVVVGHLVLHGRWVHPSAYDPRRIGYLECLKRVAVEWTVGGLICGAALALATYAVVRLTLALLPPVPAVAVLVPAPGTPGES